MPSPHVHAQVACQDGTISLYDTQQLLYRQATEAAAADKRSAHYRGAGPPPPLRPRKQIECQDVGWSIIGSAFSPDGRWIAYSSWSRYLHLANTWGQHCLHEPYLVSASRSRHFCLFTLAFSSDGTRVVGGGNDGGVHVVHLEQKTHTAVERAHFDDVNAVCFLHPDADALLVSGSDDGLVKLWDLRSPDRARGLCVGHTHGVASVASKGNGVHVVSNGKDQCAKLWCVRSARAPASVYMCIVYVTGRRRWLPGNLLHRLHLNPTAHTTPNQTHNTQGPAPAAGRVARGHGPVRGRGDLGLPMGVACALGLLLRGARGRHEPPDLQGPPDPAHAHPGRLHPGRHHRRALRRVGLGGRRRGDVRHLGGAHGRGGGAAGAAAQAPQRRRAHGRAEPVP